MTGHRARDVGEGDAGGATPAPGAGPEPAGGRAPRPEVSVVLPCLDEEESVGRCVAEALATMAAAGIEGEVVVVDNGSTDRSAAVAAAAGARVVAERRPGYGSALRAGFASAWGDVVVMADADFTYDLAKIPELVAPVRDGRADLVLGNRMGADARATMPVLHRLVGTPTLSFLISRACGRRVVGDSQSGFRAFRRERMDALGLSSDGMELASEMLIRAAQAGLRIFEIDAGYRSRIGESKLSTFSDGWRHLRLILLIAPDLLLVGPGATAVGVGVALSVITFVYPGGLAVGSLRWQPVFFSSICLVLGLQAMLAGAVLANRSSVSAPGAQLRFAFVRRPSFLSRCLVAGLALVLVGLVIDVALFFGWIRGALSPPRRDLPLASLAQSLLMVGGTLASFGAVARFVTSGDDPTSDEDPDRPARAPAVAGDERVV